MTLFNVLTTNAVDLQRMLALGQITSVQIVKEYFSQIDGYETELNALISRAPRDKVLRAAARLDEERKNGQVRSPLHGIPIVLKDCFTTAAELGMSTSCGALAFVGAKALRNSAIVQRLLDAGLIILAKANMTEFAGMKMTYMMPGWSAHGGQTLSPYVRKIEEGETILGHSAPGGSSTGSAVAVAAGFSPLAMGTETIGSIITPTNRNALYGLKPTIGVQDSTGMYTMTEFYDGMGPMAKSAADVRETTAILLGCEFPPSGENNWKGLSVGFVDPSLWTLGDDMCRHYEGTAQQMVDDFNAAAKRLEDNGCAVKHSVRVPDVSTLPDSIHLAHWEFKHICIPRFVKAFENCPIKSVEDIVNFNEANKEKAMPEPYTEQNDLIKAMNKSEDAEYIEQLKRELREKAKETLGNVFSENEVNLIAGPCDSALCVYAAAAGYPVAAVPVGTLRYNGRPFGICITARANREDILLRFMENYEAIMEPRPIPKLEIDPTE